MPRPWCFILCFFLGSEVGTAQELKPGYKINPQVHLKVVEFRQAKSATEGFFYRGQGDGFEVAIKGTVLTSEEATKELARVEYLNLFHLYDERGNPYQGQISQMVVCDPKYKPREVRTKILAENPFVLVAGVNSRKGFGACSKDQISYWAAYFNLPLIAQNTVLAVRIFLPIKDLGTPSLAAAQKRLLTIAGQLFLRSGDSQ